MNVFDLALALSVGLAAGGVYFAALWLTVRWLAHGRLAPAWLLVSAVLFLLTTAGMGLFLSTISQTQQQAMMASFFFFMPAFLLSGFAFPIRNMPVAVQVLTYLDPMRYFITIVRGIFLKGTKWEVLWPQMAALGALGVLVLGLSAWRFRKRLD